MKLLVFTAHPDDEIACLGMIEKAKQEGGEVLIVCFVEKEPIRTEEFNKACEFLGVKGIALKLEDCVLTLPRKVWWKLIEIIREFKPDTVICHSDIDYHPDHKKVNEIAQNVVEFARHSPQPRWEVKDFLMWESSNLFSYPEVIIEINDDVIGKKKKLWDIHNSQTVDERRKRYYLDFLEARARIRGTQIGKKYGEAYMRIPMPIHGDFY